MPSVTSIDDPRAALVTAATTRGVALSALSQMIGRNSAYLNQYVRRGTPKRLPERERRLLADFLELKPVVLQDPADRPGPADAAQIRGLAGAIYSARRDREVSDLRLAQQVIDWLKADGGIR